MCLHVYYNGIEEDNHLSCFIHLMPGDHDDTLEWPFRGEVTIELMNQQEDKNHHRNLIRYQSETNCRPNSDGLGIPYFISHTLLTSSSVYIKNDALYFRITVQVAEENEVKPWLVGAL